jgi:competence CoiA-like predicted nuclease
MPSLTGCLVSIELAAFLIEKLGSLPDGAFRCPHCHQPLRVHKGPGQPPHFEHATGSHQCLLRP